MPLMLNVDLEQRLQELFANPYPAEHAYEVEVEHTGDGIVEVQGPYCYWTNTHNIRNGGHRECDGPVESEWDLSDPDTATRRENYRRYACPGYTLIIND